MFILKLHPAKKKMFSVKVTTSGEKKYLFPQKVRQFPFTSEPLGKFKLFQIHKYILPFKVPSLANSDF